MAQVFGHACVRRILSQDALVFRYRHRRLAGSIEGLRQLQSEPVRFELRGAGIANECLVAGAGSPEGLSAHALIHGVGGCITGRPSQEGESLGSPALGEEPTSLLEVLCARTGRQLRSCRRKGTRLGSEVEKPGIALGWLLLLLTPASRYTHA